MKYLVFIALFLFASNGYADLTITQGSMKRVITKKDFRQLHYNSITVKDPVYKKHKRYAGYWLSDILKLAGIHADAKTSWTFIATDGYKASIDVKEVLKYGVKPFVAVRDMDAPDDWVKIKQGKEWISPEPYYLVWQTPLEDANPNLKLPWPYQIAEISIRDAKESQQKLFPPKGERSLSVIRGFRVFRQNCLACHSINLEGGVLGPELNVPKNILEYENRKFLKEFISNPSSFRARSKMPAFNTVLSNQSLDDVLDYLTWMGKHKEP